MKTSCMTNVLKKLAFPVVICGALWLGSSAEAQVGVADIMSISTTAGLEGTPVYSAGSRIEIKIGMSGNCAMTNTLPGPYSLPQLRMIVNGNNSSFAQMESYAPTYNGSTRTYFTFWYTVKPGDMAFPLKIYGNPGGATAGDKYEIVNNGYTFYNRTTTSNLVWRYASSGFISGDVIDVDFAQVAKRTIQTLSFADAFSPVTVAATESTTWRVTSQNPIPTGNSVSFFVWPANTNLVRVGTDPSKTALQLFMTEGATSVDFPITGLATGTTQIVLQRESDYMNNATVGVTNFITRTITVTAPPEPTVRVMVSGSDTATLDEAAGYNTGELTVQLSQTYAQDVWVRLSSTPSSQNNLSFVPYPYLVRVPAGSLASSVVPFSLPDGTVTSLLTGIVISPVVTNTPASTYFSRMKSATVYVRNVKPVILQPQSTDTPTPVRGAPYAFDWVVSDVPADVAAGMTLTWNFGDSTPNVVVSGAVGQVYHTYTTPATGTGTKTVKVTAKDKDGTVSDEVQFTVTVGQPVPKPSVRVVPSAILYSETSTNVTGLVNLYLSETFGEDVWVQLTTSPAGQSNIVFASTNAIKIPSGSTNNISSINFSIPDGTLLSEMSGIEIIPTVTNTLAKSYYTDLQGASVFVMNVRPKIISPLAANIALTPLTPYNNVPMGTPFPFNWTVEDVPADGPSMAVTWDFGDGVTKTVTGLVGVVYHNYSSLGDKIVRVKAVDKDLGQSDEIQFKVTVTPPSPLPTVSVLPPAGPLSETTTPSTGQITVHLSEAFTNSVTVQLNVTPVNNAANGTITLSTNKVVIAKGQLDVVVKFSARDGTDLSTSTGFLVSPVVLATPTAVATYTELVPGLIEILNVAPKINSPTAQPLTTTDVAYVIPQGSAWTYAWSVGDVALDLPSMNVTWDFGDGTSQSVTGGSGTLLHTYTVIGDLTVTVVALDKDGGRDEVKFKVRVAPSKAVNVTPIGPNLEANYWGAQGLGNGMVFSPDARSWQNLDNVYFFKYDPGVNSATLRAVPYKAGTDGYTVTNYNSSGVAVPTPPKNLYDSFFYVWVGTDQGLPEVDLNPAQAGPTTVVTLPAAQTGGTTTTPSSVDIRVIQAIFSREYRIKDNMGDINLDGIPDKIATRYNLAVEAGGAAGGDTGGTPAELKDVGNFNGDKDAAGSVVGDFLPGAASGGGAIIGGMSNVFATVGDPFTAFLEVRGFHPGLNNKQYGSDPDYGPGEINGDEPAVGDRQGTDPTLQDTDGDLFPDGWEYYFWYNGKMKNMNGSRYNPLNVAVGTVIDYKAIYQAFDPLVPATDSETGAAVNRDLDNDALSDIEELSMGTNPVNWDTDGDLMCDGWEVLRGLNPNDSRDGLNAAMYNPDGDYMAYVTVDRQFATVVGGTTTNTYLTMDMAVGNTNGTFYTWFHYGDDNAPLAVGRPVTLAAGQVVTEVVVTNALLMHFQVYNEFGFDPRTAWIGSINPVTLPQRFGEPLTGGAPNTKPFTSVDEYLLMKFMSENRMNGVGDSIPSTTGDWAAASTHPKTPDSDVVVQNGAVTLTDSMPDGWELYVSCAKGTRVMTISPWNAEDGGLIALDPPPGGDGLNNTREFAGTDSCLAYAAPALYGANTATVTITRPLGDQYWVNKFWPSDPWGNDTDGDGLSDGGESAFQYGNAVDNGSTCTPGGGMNPCSIDSDRDSLPDAWESQFTGTMPTAAPYAITNGMNGTVSDYNQDGDYDGLLNYQEYWVQADRGFRYDIPGTGAVGRVTGNAGLPIDNSFMQSSLFTEVTNVWDNARKTWGVPGPTLFVMLPVGPSKLYVSTDPRDPDTDGDGMDDYYEMFHGLNPILGAGILNSGLDDRVGRAYIDNGSWTIDYGSALLGNDWGSGLPMNFMMYPWLAGMPQSDPDADGLRNLEEKLLPNTAAPPYSNTDPSPIWLTDASSAASVTARFYRYGGMFFWPATAPKPMTYKMFTFEMNEGYDTDNDGISDKAELMQTATTQSDPQDHDDPMRRQALWFDGLNSAAQTLNAYSYGAWAFRSFTVELWARPENVQRDQVLIERPIIYRSSDLSVTGMVVRTNFRVGIAADGRVYAMFQNAGVHDAHTGVVKAYGRILATNQWVHLSARMDGAAGKFDLLVNGFVETSVPTTLIPANGVVNTLMTPNDPEPNFTSVTPGVLVVGAANINPGALDPTWADYEQFYMGFIDEVRVWDGARSNDEIRTDYTKRYTHKDLVASRHAVRASEAAGGSRVIGSTVALQPELMYHFTFDNLFSADSTASVAQTPRGFNDPQVEVNRAAGTVVGWWSLLSTHSAVYADYGYIPWIENGVDHLPIFGGATTSGTLLDADTVRNSVYYSHTQTGSIPVNNLFPNSNDPYGYWYMTSEFPAASGIFVASDLLPLGGAYAKQAVEMWDNGGASSVWADTGNDSDSDGLPDWWEAYVASVYPSSDLGWYDLYPDGSGMTTGERYMRDLANGYTATNNPNSPSYDPAKLVKQTSDLDGDGLPDWWENLYNLKPDSAAGEDGALGDPDLDGLGNYAEYLVSERYAFRLLRPNKFRTSASQVESDYFQKQGSLYLGEMFSDHDFMEDAWEDQFAPYYLSRFVYDPQMDNDEDGWSNYAEGRYSAAKISVRPDMGMSADAQGKMKYEFPIPVIATTLRYNGLQSGAGIVINAYSKPSMDSQPDATFSVSALATTAKTLPIGSWEPRIATGAMSPGSVQPGTISFQFTDMWTGVQANTGFDFDGKLYGGSLLGVWTEIGTVDYATGEFTFDMTYYGNRIIPLATPITTRNTYIDCELSYIAIRYSSTLIDGWPKQLYLGRADTGYIVEGTNYFFAFIDLNNNSMWDAGEPNGVADGFGVDIGWDRNVVNIDLKDYAPNYVRMTLNPALRSEDVIFGTGATGGTGGGAVTTQGVEARVRIQRKYVGTGNPVTYTPAVSQRYVLDKTVQLRNYIHDGDFLEMGTPGLDWGLTGDVASTALAVVYQVYLNNEAVTAVHTFTNKFDSSRAKAASTYPINGTYVYSSRPTFEWTMPQAYTAFTLEIRKGSSSGTVLYSSGTLMAPPRDAAGNCVWTAPIFAGGRVPSTGQIFSSNTAYAWRVIPQNPKYFDALSTSGSWSDWKMFRLDVNQALDSSGYGTIQARVKYYGAATNLLASRVKVQAFRNSAFSGVPEAEYTLAGSDLTAMMVPGATNVNAVLRGLTPSRTPGDFYYVRAFIDHNLSGVSDTWESWGYANYYGVTKTPYDAYPIIVKFEPRTLVYDIRIEDADSDQDWYPDAWEYEQNPTGDFLSLTGPSPATNPDTEVNPFLSVTTNLGRTGLSLFSATMALTTSDADGDGLGDMVELVLGTNVRAASSAGDGFADGAKVSLGLSPYDILNFNVTGLDLSETAATLQWNLNVQKAADLSRSLLSTTYTTSKRYEIQYKASLSDPVWTTVVTGTVTLDGVQTDKVDQVGMSAVDASQGFFRVQLNNL